MKNITKQILGDMYQGSHGPPKKQKGNDNVPTETPDRREKRTKDYMRMRASPITMPPQKYDPVISHQKSQVPKPGFISPVNLPSNSTLSREFRPITKSPIVMEEEIESGRSTPSSVGEYLDTMNIDTTNQSEYGQYDKNFYGGRKRKSQPAKTLKRIRRKNKRSKKGRKRLSKKSKSFKKKSKSVHYRKKSKNRR